MGVHNGLCWYGYVDFGACPLIKDSTYLEFSDWFAVDAPFFVMIVEGIGKVFGWTTQMIENFSLIALGVMMQALSEVSDGSRFLQASVIFCISILLFLIIAYLTFIKQDEYNYGE